MANILITIPLASWKDWEEAEKVLSKVDAQTLFYTANFGKSNPKQVEVGDLCFLVHSGKVRGRMEIVDFSQETFQCRRTGKLHKGKKALLAGYQAFNGPDQKGFMGYRYTELQA